MTVRYTGRMFARQPLPLLWLLSDARNDAALEAALASLPRGSGFVFRHYHLGVSERAARFRQLASQAGTGGHTVVLAAEPELAREWGADGVYCHATRLAQAGGLLRLTSAHDQEELAAAANAEADAAFVSPVFPTRSHPDAPVLGVRGFHLLARRSPIPVIALGGMTAERARELEWARWGAIDGLVSAHTP